MTMTPGTSIQARRFTVDGTPLGDQFQVNQAAMGDQFEPAIAMAADGRFIVTWTDRPLVTSKRARPGLWRQRYARR